MATQGPQTFSVAAKQYAKIGFWKHSWHEIDSLVTEKTKCWLVRCRWIFLLYICWVRFCIFVWIVLNEIGQHHDQFVVFISQGLRPVVPAESPTMIFATPTKVVSEAGSTAEYLGANRVPDFQRLFQVMKNRDWNRHQSYSAWVFNRGSSDYFRETAKLFL